MARPTLSQLRALPDKRTTYQWDLTFESFPAGVSAPLSSEDINIRCISSTLPVKEVQKIEYTVRGFTLSQPGTYTVSSPIELTFISPIDMNLEEFFRNWREACTQTDTGTHLPFDQVTCNIILTLLDRQDKPIWKYKLIDCWLPKYETGDMNSDNAIANSVATIEFIDVEDGRP
jgi:hypothetical protein